jgi:RHS repeat-associated protein
LIRHARHAREGARRRRNSPDPSRRRDRCHAAGRTTYRERKDNSGVQRGYTLSWDGDDRLRAVTAGSTSYLTASYNGDGLRIAKTDPWTGTHHFSWGPGGVLTDDNGAGNVYTPGLARRQGSTHRFTHDDWIGSTRYLSDSTGNSFPNALLFDAYGNRGATSGTPYDPLDFQFAGGEGYQTEYADATNNEPGVGLQYLQQRYYDPVVGRFISQDSVGLAGGLNLYEYADADPVNGLDPSGQSVVSYLLVKGAEYATQQLLEGFIRDRIRSRVKKLALKQFARGILLDASSIEHTLNDPWWITALEFIPVAGDVLEACNEGRKIHEVFQQLDALEAQVDRIAGFESANPDLIKLSGQAGKDLKLKGTTPLLRLAHFAGFVVHSEGKEHQVYAGSDYVTAIPHSLRTPTTGRSAADAILKAAFDRFGR